MNMSEVKHIPITVIRGFGDNQVVLDGAVAYSLGDGNHWDLAYHSLGATQKEIETAARTSKARIEETIKNSAHIRRARTSSSSTGQKTPTSPKSPTGEKSPKSPLKSSLKSPKRPTTWPASSVHFDDSCDEFGALLPKCHEAANCGSAEKSLRHAASASLVRSWHNYKVQQLGYRLLDKFPREYLRYKFRALFARARSWT